ncbi:ABC transporter substrate-binding protein [Devriesea agamarum]|uniref:ABC transporter substrate-binding protein n=1 Tax=Devriesea agamarum TaxID=472569 RepID=UPI00071D34E2|nr:ABC transporter substrate-binding protein [Devriesea agamarum]
MKTPAHTQSQAPSRARLRCFAPLLVAVALALTGCGPSSADRAQQSPAPSTVHTGAASGFPAAVKSCDQTIRFDKAPERIVMLDTTDASILLDLGLLDRVVARAGTVRPGAYDAVTEQKLTEIPLLPSVGTGTGGAKVSTEAVLSAKPDLVLGYDAGVNREQLSKAGVSLYSPEAFCPNYSVKKASFALVNDEVERVATIFGMKNKIPELTKKLTDQISAMTPGGKGRTAAALYVMPGVSTFYAYGTASMVDPIFTANGLANSYGNENKRVFDASMENLLDRNPDWIVLLSDQGNAQQARETFMSFNGVQDLKAVREQHVVVLPFAWTDPPSPLSVKGAVELSKLLTAQ